MLGRALYCPRWLLRRPDADDHVSAPNAPACCTICDTAGLQLCETDRCRCLCLQGAVARDGGQVLPVLRPRGGRCPRPRSVRKAALSPRRAGRPALRVLRRRPRADCVRAQPRRSLGDLINFMVLTKRVRGRSAAVARLPQPPHLFRGYATPVRLSDVVRSPSPLSPPTRVVSIAVLAAAAAQWETASVRGAVREPGRGVLGGVGRAAARRDRPSQHRQPQRPRGDPRVRMILLCVLFNQFECTLVVQATQDKKSKSDGALLRRHHCPVPIRKSEPGEALGNRRQHVIVQARLGARGPHRQCQSLLCSNKLKLPTAVPLQQRDMPNAPMPIRMR